jgi:hypothetical protein
MKQGISEPSPWARPGCKRPHHPVLLGLPMALRCSLLGKTYNVQCQEAHNKTIVLSALRAPNGPLRMQSQPQWS